jgi:hypothetical protein
LDKHRNAEIFLRHSSEETEEEVEEATGRRWRGDGMGKEERNAQKNEEEGRAGERKG